VITQNKNQFQQKLRGHITSVWAVENFNDDLKHTQRQQSALTTKTRTNMKGRTGTAAYISYSVISYTAQSNGLT